MKEDVEKYRKLLREYYGVPEIEFLPAKLKTKSIKFGMWLTGLEREVIENMYNDWEESFKDE